MTDTEGEQPLDPVLDVSTGGFGRTVFYRVRNLAGPRVTTDVLAGERRVIYPRIARVVRGLELLLLAWIAWHVTVVAHDVSVMLALEMNK